MRYLRLVTDVPIEVCYRWPERLKACTHRDITVVFAVLKTATKQTTKGWFISPTLFSIAQCVNMHDFLDLFMCYVITIPGTCEELAVHLRQLVRMFAVPSTSVSIAYSL